MVTAASFYSGENSAGVCGTVTSEGTGSVVAKGIVYITAAQYSSGMPPEAGTSVYASGGGLGSYCFYVNGLSNNTGYVYKAIVIDNLTHTYYAANVETFTTLSVITTTTEGPPAPPVGAPGVSTTQPVPNEIGATTATLGGYAYDNGGSTIIARGICYATVASGMPPEAGVYVSDGNTGTGVIVIDLTGLITNTDYVFKAYAHNSTLTGYGAQYTFRTVTPTTTAPPVPPVRTFISISVTGQGYGNARITKVSIDGIDYVSPTDPLIADIPWAYIAPNLFSRGVSFDIDPSNIGTNKILTVSWDCPNLDYNNHVNSVTCNASLWHNPATSGSGSCPITIIAGGVVTVIANLDNTV